MHSQKIRFAVLSDLHVFDDLLEIYKDDPPSFFPVNYKGLKEGECPALDLFELIEKDELSVDYVLCPGDIAHKAHPNHIECSWGFLDEVKNKMNAKKVYVTTGNHDIDSRYSYSEYDAKGMLMGLMPHYPIADVAEKNKYWANNYVLVDDKDFNLVLLNTTAFHGVSGQLDGKRFDEYKYGRISKHTIKSIMENLKGKRKDVNILLCHHHPIRYDGLKDADYSEMMGGGDLLEELL